MATNPWTAFQNNPAQVAQSKKKPFTAELQRNPDAGFNTAPTTPGNRMPAMPTSVSSATKPPAAEPQRNPDAGFDAGFNTAPTKQGSKVDGVLNQPQPPVQGNSGGWNSNHQQQGRPDMDWLRQWNQQQWRPNQQQPQQQWRPNQQQQMSFQSGYQQSPYGGQYMPPWMQYQQQPQWGQQSSYYNSMNPWGQMPFYQMQQPQMNYNNAYQQFGNQWQSPFANRPTPNYLGASQMPVVPNLPTQQPQYSQTPWG